MTCKIVISFDQSDWAPDDLRHVAGYGMFGMNITCEDNQVQDRLKSLPDHCKVEEVVMNYDVSSDPDRSMGDCRVDLGRSTR
jgi:hypothetical protein